MLGQSSYLEFGLTPGEVVSLTGTAGWELLCSAGRVWLTEEGAGDVWLDAGEGALLLCPGRTVIEATQEGANLRMRRPLAPSSEAYWRRLLRGPVLTPGLPTSLPRPA